MWRHRGKPRTEVPDQVMALLRATYRTGKIGSIAADESGDLDDESRELLSLLRIGAVRLGKRLRVQEDSDGIRFEMADKQTRKKAAK